jgi:hypothetical protein
MWIRLLVSFSCRNGFSESVAADVTVWDERPMLICKERLSTPKKIVWQGYRCEMFACFSFLYILIPLGNFSFTKYFITVLYTTSRHRKGFYIPFLSLYRNIKTLKTNWKNKNIQNQSKKTNINEEMEVQGDQNFLCNWWLQYRKLQVLLKVSPASLQTFIDTELILTPSIIPNSNYVIIVSDWNTKVQNIFSCFLCCNHQVHQVTFWHRNLAYKF